MKSGSKSRLLDGLVLYYGAVQIIHFLALTFESWRWQQFGTTTLLAPPPIEGWSSQALWLLMGTGVADAIVIPFSILFAWGWRQNKPWAGWLGALTLGTSTFSAIVFGVGTVPTGAWGQHIAYWIEAALFLPIGVLLILFLNDLVQESRSKGTSQS